MTPTELGAALRAHPRARPDVFAAVATAVAVSFEYLAAGLTAQAEEAADRVCVGCGCTEERACPNGCSWASHDPPFCTACAAADRLLEELMTGAAVHQVGEPKIPVDDLFVQVDRDPAFESSTAYFLPGPTVWRPRR